MLEHHRPCHRQSDARPLVVARDGGRLIHSRILSDLRRALNPTAAEV